MRVQLPPGLHTGFAALASGDPTRAAIVYDAFPDFMTRHPLLVASKDLPPLVRKRTAMDYVAV